MALFRISGTDGLSRFHQGKPGTAEIGGSAGADQCRLPQHLVAQRSRGYRLRPGAPRSRYDPEWIQAAGLPPAEICPRRVFHDQPEMAERIGDADKRQKCVFVIIMAQKVQVSFKGYIPADQQGGKVRVKSPAVFRGKGFARGWHSKRFQIRGVLIFDPVTAGLAGIDFIKLPYLPADRRTDGADPESCSAGWHAPEPENAAIVTGTIQVWAESPGR